MFTIPLYDDNPSGRTPFVTWLAIAICVAVFVWQVSLSEPASERAVYAFGMVPSVVFGWETLPPELALIPPWATLITSMFLHGGWMHLIGNMLYLWIFGNNVEDSLGHGRYAWFYVLCGIAAALTQGLLDTTSDIPMIGASGAIAGVLGGYVILHPRANVRVLLVIVLYIRLINVPAAIVLGIWFGLQLLNGLIAPPDQAGVAFWAHIGGFVAGMILVSILHRPDVPLWGERQSPAFAVTPVRPSRRGSVPESLQAPQPRGPWSRRSGPWS
jgi:membrane associated rhomboid family serine protease